MLRWPWRLARKKTPGRKRPCRFSLLLQDFAKRPVAARPCFILHATLARAAETRDNAVDASSQIVDPELFSDDGGTAGLSFSGFGETLSPVRRFNLSIDFIDSKPDQ